MPNIRPLHFNVPQIKNMLVDATESYNVMSRGTGKSSGIGAPWILRRAAEMPRSQGGILGATFQQILARTLPPVIASWKRMGYQQDVHFVIGREPSQKWKRMFGWQGPISKPLDSKYAIYWFNGSCQVLISQDRAGSSNGLSLAYFYNDETKLIDKEKMDDELMPTLRGDRHLFGMKPGYGGMLFTTDMPTTPKSKWILDKAEDMDVEQIALIMEHQLLYNKIQQQYLTASSGQKAKLKNQLQKISQRLWKLRIGASSPDHPNRRISKYYDEANIMDNIDVLGQSYLNRMRESLSDLKFRTSIMNERLTQIEGGFYPSFEPDYHGTDWSDSVYLDQYIGRASPPPDDCRLSSGYDKSRPLDLAFDYGKFNCMVIGQRVGREYRVFNGMHQHTPKLLQDLVDAFCNYYRYYPKKVVNYYYDHTAIAGYANTSYTYRESVTQKLRDNGWVVNEKHCGAALDHGRKYEIINELLREENADLPKLRYSRNGCRHMEVSISTAPAKEGRRGIEKDKKGERDEALDPAEATHFSDAFDTLIVFAAARPIHNNSSSPIVSMR